MYVLYLLDEDDTGTEISDGGNVIESRSTPPPQDDLPEMPHESIATTDSSTDVKPFVEKPSGVKVKSKSITKRTKLERFLEILCDKIVTSATSEMDRYFTAKL